MSRLPRCSGKSSFEHRRFEIWGFRLDHQPTLPELFSYNFLNTTQSPQCLLLGGCKTPALHARPRSSSFMCTQLQRLALP